MKHARILCIFMLLAACTPQAPVVKAPEATPPTPIIVPPQPSIPEEAPKRTLVAGMSGPDVKEVQKALKELGLFEGEAYGNFGEITLSAVLAFQEKYGLSADGQVGPKTWAALSAALAKALVEAPAPAPAPVVDESGVPQMTWDTPTRRPWSIFTYNLIRSELLPKFKKAKDLALFCPRVADFNDDKLAWLLTEMVISIAKPESGWSPTAYYYEKTMGYYSQGLLQLSYPDKEWAKFCEFDEKKDAGLAIDSPLRTINDPIKNLNCGVRILANQAEDLGAIIVDKGVYWSVIKKNGRYEKIAEITARTKALPICQ